MSNVPEHFLYHEIIDPKNPQFADKANAITHKANQAIQKAWEVRTDSRGSTPLFVVRGKGMRTCYYGFIKKADKWVRLEVWHYDPLKEDGINEPTHWRCRTSDNVSLAHVNRKALLGKLGINI